MRQVPCAKCKKPSINCECGLKEELTIQKVLSTALENYEDDKELKGEKGHSKELLILFIY